eukprot:5535419-Lingulodinium_polyedra.AAC.1
MFLTFSESAAEVTLVARAIDERLHVDPRRYLSNKHPVHPAVRSPEPRRRARSRFVQISAGP